MPIDIIDSRLSDWEELRPLEGFLNEFRVYILDEKNSIPCIQFETRQKEGFSLKYRADGIKPLMHRISNVKIEYKHTKSDGSSNEVGVEIGLDTKKDKDTENSSSSDNEKENRASDIDSRDRDQDSN